MKSNPGKLWLDRYGYVLPRIRRNLKVWRLYLRTGRNLLLTAHALGLGVRRVQLIVANVEHGIARLTVLNVPATRWRSATNYMIGSFRQWQIETRSAA